jgi:holin-like protein
MAVQSISGDRPTVVTEAAVPAAVFILIGCQLVGEVLHAALHLPIPGPVIGMFLLTAVLASRQRGKPDDDLAASSPDGVLASSSLEGASSSPGDALASSSLQRVSDALIAHMGLLFVPAGVGVIAEAGLLRAQWFPIVAGLLGSTILSLVVTGLVMHWISRPAEAHRTMKLASQAQVEARS